MKSSVKNAAIAIAMIIVPTFASADNTTSAQLVKVVSPLSAPQESTIAEGDFWCENADTGITISDDNTFTLTNWDGVLNGTYEYVSGNTYMFYLENGSISQATLDGDTLTVFGMTLVREY